MKHVRILVFSDTHRRINKCIKYIDAIKKIDYIIHLGDTVRDAEEIKTLYQQIPIEYVPGNNDFFTRIEKEKIISLSNKRIYMTHGHLYRVKFEYDTIIKRGIDLKVDILLFGHTHTPYNAVHNKMYVLNPGSVTLPNYGNPSFGIIEIEKEKVNTSIFEIK